MPQTSALQHPADTMIGGKYRIIRALGEGGMGAVYEAENTWTKRHVAVKVMHPDGAKNPEFVRRFMQEAQAAARLSHANVVDVLDMGEDADGLYIVYEFLIGEDLRARLQAVKRFSPRLALELVMPVMEALISVHERGVVHRDLKPENIFLVDAPKGTVPKVIDFGIAKVTTPDADSGDGRTITGQMVGTPFYMSPEQVMGEADIDARADVWSIGVVLYELLSGVRPFQASKVGQFVTEVLMSQPRPLDEMAPDLPLELVMAIHAALVPREQRYPSMRAFLDALEALRIGESQHVTPLRPGETIEELAARPTLPSGEPGPPGSDPRLPPPASRTPPTVQPTPMPQVAGASTPPPQPTPPPFVTPAPKRSNDPSRRGLLAVAAVLVVASGAWLVHGSINSAREIPSPGAHPSVEAVVTHVTPPPDPASRPIVAPPEASDASAAELPPAAMPDAGVAPMVQGPAGPRLPRHRRADRDAGAGQRGAPTFVAE